MTVTRARVSASMRSWSDRASSVAGVRDRVHRGRGAGDRGDARNAGDERGLADPVAVGALQRAAERRVDDEVAAAAADRGRRPSPRRPRRPSRTARPRARRPAARGRFLRSPPARSRARRAPRRPAAAPPCRRRGPRGTPSREVGSGRPAARSAFANAVGRSEARGHHLAGRAHLRARAPDRRREARERQHGSLDADLLRRPLGRQAELARASRRRPGGRRPRRGSARSPSTRTGTVRDARGFASST